jgi:hypothetical protein
MDNRDLCIICQSASRGSKEHIIPESLGNRSLITYALCESCNKSSGEKIDDYVNQMGLINLYREILRIGGKNGHIPTVLSQGKDALNRRVSFNLSKGFHWAPFLCEVDNGLLVCHNSEQEALEALRKRLARDGFSEDEIATIKKETKLVPPSRYLCIGGVKFDVKLDHQNSFLLILKIAYEYAYLKLGDQYLNDTIGNDIRKCIFTSLSNKDHGNIESCYIRKSDFLDEFLESLTTDEDHRGHLLAMFKTIDNALILYVSLFMCPELSYEVLLSKEATQYTLNCEEDSLDWQVVSI